MIMPIDDNVKQMIHKVLKQAEKESSDIVKIAEMAQKRNLRPYEEKAEKIKTDKINDGKKKLDNHYNSKKANIEMHSKFALLKEKENFENHMKNELLRRNREWVQTDSYKNFIVSVCGKYKKLISLIDTIIYINEKDYDEMKKIADSLNIQNAQIQFVKIDGGVIIENKVSHFYYDLSVNTLFNDWFENNKNKYLS